MYLSERRFTPAEVQDDFKSLLIDTTEISINRKGFNNISADKISYIDRKGRRNVMIILFADIFYILSALLSVALLICSIKNKDKKNNKYILIADFIYIAYAFGILMLINRLPVYMDWGILFDLALLAVIVSVNTISAGICMVKNAKEKVVAMPGSKRTGRVLIVALLLPVMLLLLTVGREMYLVKQSSLLLAFRYGSGSMAGGYFFYVLNDRYCEKVDTDISLAYEQDYIGKFFLPAGTEPTDIESINFGEAYTLKSRDGRELTVKIGERGENSCNTLYIYLDGKEIYSETLKDKYFDISLERAYSAN